jgi:dienelactone hydrolase
MSCSEIVSKLTTFAPSLTNNSSPTTPLSEETQSCSLETKNLPETKTEENRPEQKPRAKEPSIVLPTSRPSLEPIASQDPHFFTPELTGDFKVGVKSFYADTEKRLLVDLHYPGVPSKAPAYRILPLSPEKHPMNIDNENSEKIDKLANLWTRSQPGLEAVEGKFPVVLFSHGMGSNHFDYQHLVEDLASHGYCVITINHRQTNAFSTLAKISAPEPPPSTEVMTQVTIEQANDVLFLANQIQEGALNEQIGANIDVNRIGVMGHSVGGDTALQACRQPDLIRTGIDLDGGGLRHTEKVAILKPFLTIGAGNGAFGEPFEWNGETWNNEKEWAESYKASKELAESHKVSIDSELCILLDARHEDFSIQPLFIAVKTDIPNPKYAEIYTKMRKKIVGWFNTHLKDS